MTPYTIALFLHLVGATGLFVALGLEWTSLAGLRRATAVEEARTWLSVASPLRRLVPISMAALLLAGLYLMAAGWGATPWVIAGVLSLLLIGDLGGALTGPRLARIGRAIGAESGPLSERLREGLRDPILWTSLRTRLGIVVGTVFVMTVKPDAVGSLLALTAALALGLASSVPALRRSRRAIARAA